MPTSESSTSSSDQSEPSPDHVPNGAGGSSAGSSRSIAPNASAGSDLEYESDSDSDGASDTDYIAPHTRRAYLAHLSSHISTTANPEKPPEPSLFLPTSHWSSVEKEAFFRALNIYSRLRPDLIAAAIRSKGVADVCAYIDALDEALFDSLESSRGKGKGKEKLTYTSLARANFPAAYEASEAWVEREEHIAQATITEERKMLADTVDRNREEEVRSMRRSVRARKRRKVHVEGRDKDRDREGEKARRARFEQWLSQCRVEWEVRDVIDALDGTMLKAMDTLLREDEEARSGLESEGTGLAGDDRKPLEETKPETTSTPVENIISEARSHEPMAPTFDESLIDPALRGLPSPPESSLTPPEPNNDNEPGPDTAPQAPPPSHHTHDRFNPVTPPFPSASLPAPTPPPPVPTLPHLSAPIPEREQSQSVNSSSVDQEGRLSPTSRRRAMKRLYMRRKRAEARGDVADMRNVRLRPGRKPKPRPKRKSGTAGSMAPEDEDGGDGQMGEGDASEDAENADGEKRTRHPHSSGKTLPYKIRERLNSLGIDVGWLQQEGLDFFHLSAVNRLMKSYNTLEDAGPGINSQISADALRLLLAHVVYFTTRLVRLAIVSRDQEMVAKMHTKVWRLASNQLITVPNVDHALSLLGVDVKNKKTHFQRLLDDLPLEEDEESDDGDNSVERAENNAKKTSARRRLPLETDADDEDEEEEAEEPSPGELGNASSDVPADPLSTLPLHRQVFPPFVRLPASLQPSHTNPSSHSLLTHIPWARTAPDAHDDEDLLALETDEEALDAELEEEEKLDERDRAQDASHERALWSKFGEDAAAQTRLGKRKRGAELGDEDEDEDEDREYEDEMGSDDLDDDVQYAADSMRYRKPGGRVKSAVYVEDSD